MGTVQIVFLVALAVVGLWVLAAYNRLVKHRNELGNAFAQIDVQLKRRYDLIPNLVDVARKYVQHERDTLEAVIAARNGAKSASEAAALKPADAARIGALAGAEGALAGLMSKLAVVVEAYPALKADATLPGGATLSVGGFLVVEEEKLQKLPDAAVLEMHRNGMLMLLHMHLGSLVNMRAMVERKARRAAAA